MRGCAERLLVFGVVRVSFAVIELKESVQGGEIDRGSARDGDCCGTHDVLALDPIAVAHERFDVAVGGEAVDAHGGATDHPVDMDEAFIGAES